MIQFACERTHAVCFTDSEYLHQFGTGCIGARASQISNMESANSKIEIRNSNFELRTEERFEMSFRFR